METTTMPMDAGANCNNKSQPDTLPFEESQSQKLQQSSQEIELKKGTWGILHPHPDYITAYKQRQLDLHDQGQSINHQPLEPRCLVKDEYTAGRLEHLDIQFTEQNTELKRLLQISKTQFIIKRERITNYETANYKGDFVVVIYDKSSNGTFVNQKKLENKKAILFHNDSISIAKPDYEVFKYVPSTVLPNSDEIPSELAKNYVALRILGRGICGPVRLVYSKTNYCPFALKCITKNGLDKTAHKDLLVNPEGFMNEVDILKGLKHPNVIKMVHAINTPLNLFIMLELMQGGELFERIRKNVGLSEKLAKFYFYQIATAVEYLHGKGITHRDLKPENILLLNNDEYTLVKVTDFGMSKLVNYKTMMKTFCGTPYYAAPEILASKGAAQYTSKVDVWSLGVILYVMLSSCVPFTKRGNKELNDVIIEGKFGYPPDRFEHVSGKAKRLIDRMLIVNPNARYTVSDVVVSSWLDDGELIRKISKTLQPYINSNNYDSENTSPNVDSGIGSLQRRDKFLNDIQMKRPRFE
ncbi:ovarian-specific serine/threonine-protein kinase Lok-like [Aphidius gifuensis]|uniref:ovarian-specific serine/threonine-protein kinase Lok-like n=1 Tax=Aphidius gifuensis TaxID=684658 RepID=UPI001CDC14AA|nr:ovarian-specific serine/threonine-protein kinase Lok-like [Aphidius gifuensis]